MREREAETQAEGEAGSMHREPNVGFDPGSPGTRPGPKAGAKPLRHPGIPTFVFWIWYFIPYLVTFSSVLKFKLTKMSGSLYVKMLDWRVN